MTKRHWETTANGLRCVEHDKAFAFGRSCPKCKRTRKPKSTSSPAPAEPVASPPSAGTGGGVELPSDLRLERLADNVLRLASRLDANPSDRDFTAICAEIRKTVESVERIEREREDRQHESDIEREVRELKETMARLSAGGGVEPPQAQDSTEVLN